MTDAGSGEGEVIVVELAKDLELMREALEALERSADELHRRALCDWDFYECQKLRCEESRSVIAKLEERLLKE